MDKDSGYIGMLFENMADFDAKKLKYCRTCIYRKPFGLNEFSRKRVQCCILQPSKRSNSGYKTIKVTNISCSNYKEEE